MRFKFYILSFVFLFSGHLFAQNGLSGKIKNKKDGSPVVAANIYISDLQLGAVSDAEGNYKFTNIPAGNYLVGVSHVGFASAAKEVEIQNETTFDFEMGESRIELNEVIVTGFASATEKQSTAVPVSVVHEKDLQQNSATNIIDAISMTPGVSQITIGPAISKPVIRGLGYNRVVVVNDGIRQEGQQWGDEFGIEVDEYSVNRVEIYKGPASLRYGSDAMAGVINMIAAPAVPEGSIKGNVLLNYQSNNGLLGTSINLAGNNKGLFWDLRYSHKQAHAYQNQYDGYVWNSGYAENNWKGSVGINRKWGYSHLTTSSFDQQLGIVEGARDAATGKFITDSLTTTGPKEVIAPDDKYKAYNYFPIIHQRIQHYKFVLDNNFAIGKGLLGVRLGYQINHRKEANDPDAGDVYNNYFFLRTGNYDLRYVFSEENKFELSVGANGMVQASEDRGTVFLVPEYNSFDLGLYAIAKKSFDKLSLSGGVRYDNRILHGKDLYTDTTTFARTSGPAATSSQRFAAYHSDFSGMSASIGAAYNFTSNWYGKLNLSRGFRAPNIAESGANGIHDGTPFYEIGDAKLKAESSLQVDATLGYVNEDVSFEINAFSNNINNYIFPIELIGKNGKDSLRADPSLGFSAARTFKHIQRNAVLSGGEVVFSVHPRAINWLTWSNSFSMVNSVRKNQSDTTKYIPYTPPYRFHSDVMLKVVKEKGSIKNGYVRVGFDHFFDQDKINFTETRTPGYNLVSLGIGADICSRQKPVCSVFIMSNNIFDIAYQSHMSRLKYSDPNIATGRVGVFNMGRNISFKVVIPINFKRK